MLKFSWIFEDVKLEFALIKIKNLFSNFQISQDLSPIYEEIHGGSRSSVSSRGSCASSGGRSASSRSASTSNSSHSSSASDLGKFFYSLYDFEATDATMLTAKRGQVVRVVHSTVGEWCYVEDRYLKIDAQKI